MDPVRGALDRILAGHEPYPAVIVDRRWDLVTRQRARALAIFTEGVAPAPARAADQRVPPRPAPGRPGRPGPELGRVQRSTSITQLRRDAALSGDADLAALLDEVRGYPGVVERGSTVLTDPAQLLFLPMRARACPTAAMLSLFSTIATFGTALDVTLAELSASSSSSPPTRPPSRPSSAG